MSFFGTEVTNSYKQVFGRDGRGILADGNMVYFHTPFSLQRLYVSVSGNQMQSTDTEQFKMHTVVNTLGSVVDMFSVPSLKNLCRVWELEELALAS